MSVPVVPFETWASCACNESTVFFARKLANYLQFRSADKLYVLPRHQDERANSQDPRSQGRLHATLPEIKAI